MATPVDDRAFRIDSNIPVVICPFKAQTRRSLIGIPRSQGVRLNPAFLEEEENVEPRGRTLQTSFASSTSYLSIQRVHQHEEPDSFGEMRRTLRSSMASNYSSATYMSIQEVQNNTYISYFRNDTNRFYFKALGLIISALIIVAAIVLIFYLYNNAKEQSHNREGNCTKVLAHFGSESKTTCTYGYLNMSEVEIIQLKTKNGDINFTDPFKEVVEENRIKSSSTEITEKEWTLTYKASDDKTEIFFQKNVTDCELIGSYEVVIWSRNNPLEKTSFHIDIADNFTTNSVIQEFLDHNLENAIVELHCDGFLYCKDFLFYKANVDEGESSPTKTEHMFCTLNRTPSGVVKTTCSNQWTHYELLKRDITLQCVPETPLNMNNTNSLPAMHTTSGIKGLCMNNRTPVVGSPFDYNCKIRLHNTDIVVGAIDVELLKDQERILNFTNVTGGLSNETSNGRILFSGHIERDILVLNITFTVVYYCDGGEYIFRTTNTSDITFKLNLQGNESSTCKSDYLFPWQGKEKYGCQFCSERNVSVDYEKDMIPPKGVNFTQQFDHGMVKLNFSVTNMSCDTSIVVYILGDVNRTISLITEAPFFGNVEKNFSKENAINQSMSFRYYLGCSASVKLLNVTGEAVIQSTENVIKSQHNGVIVENVIMYQTSSSFNGSWVSSVVTYTDHNMTTKQSEGSFQVIHISDDFCVGKKEDCNYEYPSFPDRFVSCTIGLHPVVQYCVENTEFQKNDSCHGWCLDKLSENIQNSTSVINL